MQGSLCKWQGMERVLNSSSQQAYLLNKKQFCGRLFYGLLEIDKWSASSSQISKQPSGFCCHIWLAPEKAGNNALHYRHSNHQNPGGIRLRLPVRRTCQSLPWERRPDPRSTGNRFSSCGGRKENLLLENVLLFFSAVLSNKDNPGTLPINLYAQVQLTSEPLDFSKIAENVVQAATHSDNWHDLLYTCGDVVYLGSDAILGGWWYVLQENVSAFTKKARATLFEGDPFNLRYLQEFLRSMWKTNLVLWRNPLQEITILNLQRTEQTYRVSKISVENDWMCWCGDDCRGEGDYRMPGYWPRKCSRYEGHEAKTSKKEATCWWLCILWWVIRQD